MEVNQGGIGNINYPLIADLDDNDRSWWKWFNIIISPLLIILLGVVRFRGQRNKSNQIRATSGSEATYISWRSCCISLSLFLL